MDDIRFIKKYMLQTRFIKEEIENDLEPARNQIRKPKKRVQVSDPDPDFLIEEKKPVKKRKSRNSEEHAKSSPESDHEDDPKRESSRKRKNIKLDLIKIEKFVNLNEVKEPLVCEVCKKTFPSHVDLGLHSKHHNEDCTYSCHQCDFRAEKKGVFKNHVQNHDMWKCEKCNKIFRNKRCALKHSKTHFAKSFVQCEICGKDVRTAYLDTHKKLVHADEKNVLIYKCTLCDKSYKNSTALKGHYSYNHKDYGIDTSVICDICGMRLSCKGKLAQHTRTHTGDRPYPCTVCPRKFISKDILRAHMRVHTGEKPYVCMYCGKKFAHGAPYRSEKRVKRKYKKKKLSKIAPTKLGQPLRCESCPESFTNHVDFALHSKTHNKKGLYSCHQCEFSATSKATIEIHVRDHENSNLYRCEICNKAFKVSTHAVDHKNIHTGEKPYKCEICGNQFSSAKLLSSHRMTKHYEVLTGKPLVKYDCKICNKHYMSFPGLKHHMYAKHNETGEDKSIICDICGKKLKDRSKYKFHKRIHLGDKPHSCSVCAKNFIKKECLEEHMRTHTGEKPYRCEVCGKAFAQRAPYWYHRKTHTGEKPNICQYCGKGFISKPVRNHHSKSCFVKMKSLEGVTF
ncbi:hypothetical protein JTB14_006908 [Gonioctena quinquepunctata]|nr:hypothetical protein JTB14_006908 [Gonioctena quinquepunctata]